ncbi:unnamed protein product [Adineta ricciae]|uniref:Carboxylesterase type B domain-containing protein n=1 Tax=Adineta ricciae TaxID=249248 RepID=A0A815ZY68_ADIRI|nr:unnamed protein product [Adineta ricciae]
MIYIYFANDFVGRPFVSTTSGRFVGFTIHKKNTWIGILYVAPPIGELSKGYCVWIWIHGGGFQESSSTVPVYDSPDWPNDTIENKNPFIMVNFNYRLNAMGFFVHPTSNDKIRKMIANQGISDQREAIKWIRENIAQFRDDQGSITFMGGLKRWNRK